MRLVALVFPPAPVFCFCSLFLSECAQHGDSRLRVNLLCLRWRYSVLLGGIASAKERAQIIVITICACCQAIILPSIRHTPFEIRLQGPAHISGQRHAELGCSGHRVHLGEVRHCRLVSLLADRGFHAHGGQEPPGNGVHLARRHGVDAFGNQGGGLLLGCGNVCAGDGLRYGFRSCRRLLVLGFLLVLLITSCCHSSLLHIALPPQLRGVTNLASWFGNGYLVVHVNVRHTVLVKLDHARHLVNG